MTLPYDKVAVVVLASGLSTRFGDADKLMSPLNGYPLGAYVADTFASHPRKFAVIGMAQTDRCGLFPGWPIIWNARPEDGQGETLALAARRIMDTDAAAMLILLADMPFITFKHMHALIENAQNADVAISTDGKTQSPPALFRRSVLPKLAGLTGDKGAKQMLSAFRDLVKISVTAKALLDVDTVADLKAIEHIHVAKKAEK